MTPWVGGPEQQHTCRLPYAGLGPDKVGHRWKCGECGALWVVDRTHGGTAAFRLLDPEPGQRITLA